MSLSNILERINKQYHNFYQSSKQIIEGIIKMQHTIKKFWDEVHKFNEDMLLTTSTNHVSDVFEDGVKFRNPEFIQDNVLWKFEQNVKIYDIIQ